MITEITRNAVFSKIKAYWNGQLDPIKFLERIYALDELPSEDRRFETFRQDIIQHTVNNEDWADDWIFSDKRLALDETDKLLTFLAQVFHPAVSPDVDRTIQRVKEVNQLLRADGYEFFESGHISGRPVWSHRKIQPQVRPSGNIPDSIIAVVSTVLSNRYSHSELDTLFERHDIPRPIDFGSNKQTKAKAWIAQINKTNGIDRWEVLGEIVAAVIERNNPTIDKDQAELEIKDIVASLAKKGLTYLKGGVITRQILSDSSHPITEVEIAPWISDKNKIGEGGFGKVYRYEDRRLNLNFAIKVYDPHPFQNDPQKGKQRFFREAALLFKLKNKYVIQIYDAGELPDGRPFIKMEYFPGTSLAKHLEQTGVLSPLNRMIVIGRIANALAHAHEQKIIHRDLKPTNVLIDGNNHDIRLIDFGLAVLSHPPPESACVVGGGLM